MRRRVVQVALTVLLAIGQSGCLALGCQVVFWAGDVDDFPECVMVYRGTQLHFEMLRETDDLWQTSPCQVFPAALVLIDLPFTFCVDTALLPISAVETAYMAVRHWMSPRRTYCEEDCGP